MDTWHIFLSPGMEKDESGRSKMKEEAYDDPRLFQETKVSQ